MESGLSSKNTRNANISQTGEEIRQAKQFGLGVTPAHITRSRTITEETPLLGEQNGASGAQDSKTAGGSGSAWPGQADFKGLPWWKRPSVGYPSSCWAVAVFTEFSDCRFTGCSHRSLYPPSRLAALSYLSSTLYCPSYAENTLRTDPWPTRTSRWCPSYLEETTLNVGYRRYKPELRSSHYMETSYQASWPPLLRQSWAHYQTDMAAKR